MAWICLLLVWPYNTKTSCLHFLLPLFLFSLIFFVHSFSNILFTLLTHIHSSFFLLSHFHIVFFTHPHTPPPHTHVHRQNTSGSFRTSLLGRFLDQQTLHIILSKHIQGILQSMSVDLECLIFTGAPLS